MTPEPGAGKAPLGAEDRVVASDAALAAAWATLDRGDFQRARAIAQSVLESATARDDLSFQAQALICLAHCDRVGSRPRRASDASREAAQIFKQLGDIEGEAKALTSLAHVCMLLGRNDEAVDAALLGVRLCDPSRPEPHAVLAYNCLGLCYSWAGDCDRADAALETAVGLAAQCRPALSTYQPRLNLMWVEASRLIEERYHAGTMQSLERFERLAAECQALERAGLGFSVMPGLQAMRHTLSLASYGLLETWKGRVDDAAVLIEGARASLTGEASWLDALVHWCDAESAWALEDWPRAEAALQAMHASALSVEHEQLGCRAQLLLSQVYERQRKFELAMREYRALRRRERRVASEGLGARESQVKFQLGIRQSERHLETALLASRQFERWSLEDALTGIANRRCFELALKDSLARGEAFFRPLAVAMLDVDRFKSINDRHTHRIGDRVLKTVAALIASRVRENDLPARWAGDEFVIVFDDADRQTASQICQRIKQAIGNFDWNSIAPDLSVSVTVGISQAEPGDTAETILHRSDELMYASKPMDLAPDSL